MYYHCELESNKTNPKQMWNTLRTVLLIGKQKSNGTSDIEKVKCNNVELNQPFQIAQQFNDHFLSIGTKLANWISTNEDKYLSFLTNRISSSIVLIPPTPNDVYNRIFSLKTKKYVNQILPSYFLKTGTSVLSSYLALLISNTFNSGIFPDILIVARMVPVFKSGSKSDINNYRPISVLPCLSKYLKKSFWPD